MTIKDMTCYDDTLSVKGNFYTEGYKEFTIIVSACTNYTGNPVTCQSPADIATYVSTHFLEVFFFQKNVDFSNYTEPIQYTIDDTNLWAFREDYL